MHHLTKALKNKISGMGKVTYKAKPESLQSTVKGTPTLTWKNSPKKNQMKQYGDKGYKPATGEGTGY